MELYECEDAVQRALTRPRPKHIVKIINKHLAEKEKEKQDNARDGNADKANGVVATSAVPAKRAIDFVCIDCRDDGTRIPKTEANHCSSGELIVMRVLVGPEGRARAFFSAPPPTIVFCANRLHSANEVEETMVHELIHAYDFTVRKMDITKPDILACSEIRSARESECYQNAKRLAMLMPEVEFFQNSLTWFHKRCVREHAVRSTRSMFPDEAQEQVEKMFDSCYADHSPFPSPKPK